MAQIARFTHEKPKLLVTGLSGLIGSRLKASASLRFDLVPIDVAGEEKIDITDRAQLLKFAATHGTAKALVHLAAYTDVSRAHAQTGDKTGPCYRINALGTENVARACAENGFHLIHVSTDFVFDGSKQGAYVESDSPKPIEWYGRTKLMAEEAARKAPAWTIVRIAYPYCPQPAPRPDLVQTIYNSLVAGREVSLFTDQLITPTFGDDLAQGIALLARALPKGEIYHLVGSSSLSPFDLGLKIARAFKFDESLVRSTLLADHLKKDPRPRHRRLQLSNAKWTAFAQKHGLHRPLTIDVGLARVVKNQPIPIRNDEQ